MSDVLEHHAINYARSLLVHREEQWLEKSGWKRTCSTPGSYWMWQKEWDGKTLLLMRGDAAMFQGVWDSEEEARLHPERYED